MCLTCWRSNWIPIRKFTQQGVPLKERGDYGLHAAFKSVFPIVSYSGNAALEYVDYTLGYACVRRQ